MLKAIVMWIAVIVTGAMLAFASTLVLIQDLEVIQLFRDEAEVWVQWLLAGVSFGLAVGGLDQRAVRYSYASLVLLGAYGLMVVLFAEP